jgi:hypothetical protein
MNPKTFKCKTPLAEGYFTLDNAKFWYLNFIYNFMYKCLDMNRIHFIEGDTDSMYFAVAGNLQEDNTQGFKYVIKDEKFYDDNIYKFAPSGFYSTGDKLTFTSKLEQKQFDKKLLGLEIEKQCDNMIALAPKMYSCSNGAMSIIPKCKGYRNNKLKFDDYNTIVVKKQSITGTNHNLQLHNNQMSMTAVGKNVLTAPYTKYCVAGDFSTCVPLFINVEE